MWHQRIQNDINSNLIKQVLINCETDLYCRETASRSTTALISAAADSKYSIYLTLFSLL